MALTDAQRARYARHLLLPEVAEPGQTRLLTSAVRPLGQSEPGTLQVAKDYLERAGLLLSDDEEALPLLVPSAEVVQQLAGKPELLEAARALAGAFAAVESIKTVIGIGSPSELPSSFSLASEDA